MQRFKNLEQFSLALIGLNMSYFFWSYLKSLSVIIATRPGDKTLTTKVISTIIQINPDLTLRTICILGCILSLIFVSPFTNRELRRAIAVILYFCMMMAIGYNIILLQVHYAFLSLTLLYYGPFYSKHDQENFILIKNNKIHSKYFLQILFMSSLLISGCSKLFFFKWNDGTLLQGILSHLSPDEIGAFFQKIPLFYFKLISRLIALYEIICFPLYLWNKTRFISWMAVVLLHIGIFLFVQEVRNIAFTMIFVQLFYYEPTLFDESWGKFKNIKNLSTLKIKN